MSIKLCLPASECVAIKVKIAGSTNEDTIKCKFCNTEITPTSAQKWKQKKGLLDGFFCSRSCRGKASQKRHTADCLVCGKQVTRLMSQVRKSKSGNIFCSPQCGTIWSNWKGPKFKNPSWLESELLENLRKSFPEIKIVSGSGDVINSEIDIWIPELNLAVEVNGPHHYEVLRGDLKKYFLTLQNDLRKIRDAREAGIELYVINTSHTKKKKAFDRYFPQLRDLISAKLKKSSD